MKGLKPKDVCIVMGGGNAGVVVQLLEVGALTDVRCWRYRVIGATPVKHNTGIGTHYLRHSYELQAAGILSAIREVDLQFVFRPFAIPCA